MNRIIDPEPKTLRGGEDKVYDVDILFPLS